MKIAQNNIPNFLKNFKSSKHRAILLYGPDQSLVKARLEYLLNNLVYDQLNLTKLTNDLIKNETGNLSDEVRSRCFNGHPRIIVIENVEGAINATLKEIILSCTDNYLLIIAGELPASSGWRKFFEDEEKLAALPCYKEEGQIAKLLEYHLKKDGYSYEPQIISLIENLVNFDRQIAMSEFEKIKNYMGEDKHISVSVVEQLLVNNNEFSLDNLCFLVASGNIKKSLESINQAYNFSTPAIAIIRSLIKYFWRIKIAKTHIEQGKNPKQAVDMLLPPVFYKSMPGFIQNLNRWDVKTLTKVLEILLRCELSCKANYSQIQILLEQSLISILNLAKQEKIT